MGLASFYHLTVQFRRLGWPKLGILWLCYPLWAQAQLVTQETPLALLEQLGRAAHEQSYQGTFVVQRGNDMESVRVIHANLTGEEKMRMDVLDGRPREMIRSHQETRCYYPMQRKVRLETGYQRRLFPALIQAPYEHYLDFYAVSVNGTSHVAGHECREIRFSARDNARFDHEFCADTATGLMLKAVTFDAQQSPIETMLFTELKSFSEAKNDDFLPRFPDLSDWKTVRYPQSTKTGADPIHVGYVPEGFAQTLDMTMPAPSGHGELHHWVYSDGLSSFSIFARAQGPQDTSPAISHVLSDALGYYSASLPRYHVVVLGEIPQETIQAIGQSISITEVSHP